MEGERCNGNHKTEKFQEDKKDHRPLTINISMNGKEARHIREAASAFPCPKLEIERQKYLLSCTQDVVGNAASPE